MNYKFNETLLTIPPSASLAVSEKAKRLKAEGIDVITLEMCIRDRYAAK